MLAGTNLVKSITKSRNMSPIFRHIWGSYGKEYQKYFDMLTYYETIIAKMKKIYKYTISMIN
jgi:hypothetical protein